MGDGGGGHWLVQMEWRPAGWMGWSVCLPLKNLPLHHKVQTFSSGTSSPRWSRKKGRETVVVVWFSSSTYSGRKSLWISGTGFHGPDALPVIQPTVPTHCWKLEALTTIRENHPPLAAHHFFTHCLLVWFYCSLFMAAHDFFFFFFFPPPNLSGRRLDVYHTSTHGVALVQI